MRMHVNSEESGAADPLHRYVPALAIASAGVCLAGTVFLVLFFSTWVLTFGILNDVAVIIQYSLMLPIAASLNRIIKPGRIAIAAGYVGMFAVIALQVSLVAGIIPFAVQSVPVSIAFLTVLAWLLLLRRAGADSGLLPGGFKLHVLAGLYFGYPFWAVGLARRYREFLQGQ